MKPTLRYMNARRADLELVMALERAGSNEDFWPAARFADFLGSPANGVLLLLDGPELLGYVCFETRKDDNLVERLLVAPARRRQGLASQLLLWVQNLGGPRARPYTMAVARESDLAWQLTLKSAGFRCKDVYPDFFEHPPDAGYVFLWSHREATLGL